MILTCPECATGYFVDDAKIRPEGRAVRCAACGARWTAFPEPPLDLAPPPPPAAESEPESAEDRSLSELTGLDLPKAFRSRAENERRMRTAAITGAVWAGVAVVVLAIVGSAIVFRESVVRTFPRSASVYAAIGLPVNPIGLVIESVKVEPSLQDGHAAYAVSGVIRNVEDREVTAPPLRISLFNAQGKRVAGQIAMPADPRIPPGETRHFAVAILDPPFSSHDLQVDFADRMKRGPAATRPAKAGAAPTAAPTDLALRGPAATEVPAPPSAQAGPPPASAPAVPPGKAAAPHV
ncbi:MAG: DUF3426 domain-containing protein [Caulobacterales bacterium]